MAPRYRLPVLDRNNRSDPEWVLLISALDSRMTVLDWLLDSDPAIRWQVLRDLVRCAG